MITLRASYISQKPQGEHVRAAAYPQETGEQGYKLLLKVLLWGASLS